jgi:hypothetical protein
MSWNSMGSMRTTGKKNTEKEWNISMPSSQKLIRAILMY